MKKNFTLYSVNYNHDAACGSDLAELVFVFTFDQIMLAHINDISWYDNVVLNLVDDMYKLAIMRVLDGENEDG